MIRRVWLLLLLTCHAVLGSELKVVTFNVRRLSPALEKTRPKRSWVEYPWAIRSVYIARQIMSSRIDIVGFQEVRGQQMQDLQSKLSSRYDSVFRGRNADQGDSEGVPIFWLKSKFSLISVEHFWLSTTPNVPGSKSWDSSKVRMATKVFLRPRSKNIKTTIVLINTHWDGQGPISRRRAAPLVLREVCLLYSSENWG
jgi:endonuclease/exonuclease/phosphatase family metal-dependent hydrolase